MILVVASLMMVVLFLCGLHVASALGLIGMALMYLFSDRPLWDVLGQVAWNVNSSSTLVAIPLFVMMGEVLIHSRLAERLYSVLSHWLAPLPGGLLHSNIVFCAVFGAISGSSAACAATVSSVALPAFRARNYNERLVIGSMAAGGPLDLLIPPSIAMIIYGVMAEESIGRLYLAGFLPGFLLAGIFMFIIAVTAMIWPSVAPREAAPSWRLRLIGLLSLFPVLFLMFIVLGTIYLGIATATEAAAFGVVAAFCMAAANGTISRQMLQHVMLKTVRTSSMIMLIVTSGFILSFALAILGVPAQLTGMITQWNLSPVMFVAALVVFYMFLGTFMEAVSMMVVTVPILVPVLRAMGVDLVWFGIIMVILMEAALVSPPEGLNLYIIQGARESVSQQAGVKAGTMLDVWLGVLPFMAGMAICIVLLFLFPNIALWLPNLVMGK